MDASRQPSNFDKFSHEVRLAYKEYLTVPTIMIIAFAVLAIAMVALEKSDISWLDQLRVSIERITFGGASSTQTTLAAAAGALITITSITFTVLLLAVQQAAGSLSPEIVDQFLRRPFNQIAFGYFVGMSLYAVIVLATTHSSFDPVLSALLSFIFSGIALYLLAALVYVTLTQMRPPLVIHAIHDAVLEARQRQLPIIQRTRRAPRITGGTRVPVQSRGDGYVANIDLKTIQRAIGDRRDDLEIVLHVQIGSYVALHDEVAEIRAGSAIKTGDLSQAILQALKLGPVRDLQYDPEHGIIQIMNIGWTSISTSKQNPVPGTEAINALRDFLGRWVGEEADPPDLKKLPVVYRDDISSKPLYMLESLAVVATESMQHQNFALVLRAFAKMFDRLSPAQRSQVEEIIPRILSRLQYEVLTTELDEALSTLADALDTAGRGEKTAQVVWEARQQARSTIQGLADTEDSA